jgi:serine/threonine protein kinase
MSSVNNNNILRNMACNILKARSLDTQIKKKGYLEHIKAVPSIFGGARKIFKSKNSTNRLIEMAMTSLDGRIARCADRPEFATIKSNFRTIKKEMQAKRKARSQVNVKQFQKSNPIIAEALTTLRSIDASKEKARGQKLGAGTFGEVYACTVKIGGQDREVIVKIPTAVSGAQELIDVETAVGDALRKYLDQMQSDSLISDYQGLSVIAVPIKLENGVEIQERIKGMDGWSAIQGKSKLQGGRLVQKQSPYGPFANGSVDNPQKAVERTAGLVLGLHAFHRAGKVHHDLKPNNMMVEPDGDDFRFRIIDLGLAVNVDKRANMSGTSNGAPECLFPRPGEAKESVAKPSYDMYTLGTMLPSLFFGSKANEAGLLRGFYGANGNPPAFVQCYRNIESNLANQMLQPEIQEYESNRTDYIREEQFINQLEAEYNQKLTMHYKQEPGTHDFKLDVMLDNLNLRKNRLNARKEQLNAQLQNLHSRHNTLVKDPKVQQQLQEQMKRDMLSNFQRMNQAMYQATGQFYPEPVLQRLAAMTADCLSMDPSRRPSAEQVLLALQNMGLSSWQSGQYNIQDVPEPEPGSEQARIQEENLRKFPWIYGNTLAVS